MSGASPSSDRPIRPEESALVESLLEMFPEGAALKASLRGAMVHELTDGGMGGLRFASDHRDRKAHEVASVSLSDEDGVPLEVSLNLDQDGALYELDIWKVDFSSLRRYPSPGDLRRA